MQIQKYAFFFPNDDGTADSCLVVISHQKYKAVSRIKSMLNISMEGKTNTVPEEYTYSYVRRSLWERFVRLLYAMYCKKHQELCNLEMFTAQSGKATEKCGTRTEPHLTSFYRARLP